MAARVLCLSSASPARLSVRTSLATTSSASFLHLSTTTPSLRTNSPLFFSRSFSCSIPLCSFPALPSTSKTATFPANIRPSLSHYRTPTLEGHRVGPAPQLRRFQSTSSGRDDKYMIQVVKVLSEGGNDILHIQWRDGHVSSFHSIWLQDHSPSNYNAQTNQREKDVLNLNPKAKVEITQVVDGTDLALRIGGECATFELSWLRDRCYSQEARKQRATAWYDSLVTWDAATLAKHHSEIEVEYEEWMSERPKDKSADISAGLRKGLTALHKYGILFVTNVPMNMEATQAMAERIGAPRATLYGTMWDTMPRAVYNDTAYTSAALQCHTDGTYFHTPHGIQLFNCVLNEAASASIEKDGEKGDNKARGGDKLGTSLFMDGFRIAEELKRDHPDTFHFLSTTPLRFSHEDTESNVYGYRCPIELGEQGEIRGFSFNFYDIAAVTFLPADRIHDYYKHVGVITKLIKERDDLCFKYLLNPGKAVFVANRRVLHGREEFSGMRNLLGCYIGDDEYVSRLKVHHICNTHKDI